MGFRQEAKMNLLVIERLLGYGQGLGSPCRWHSALDSGLWALPRPGALSQEP